MTTRLAGALTLVLSLVPAAARAQTVDFDAATIQQLAAAMDAGTVTSERLVQLALARVDAFDDRGPVLNAVLTPNPQALAQARALDAERKATGKRSLLHGIPIVLKDNFDTFDLPTTGGSVLLAGSVPPDDAFVVKKLRDAGAVILAKVNMSEFASGGAFSSLGGQTRNPHDPLRSPSGSSGGTGAAIAAGYALLGLGTDTGGSVRGPSTANGIVGLKPTHGLLSRDGIIPLALSFDTGGPMARNVADIAVALGVMTGVDAADAATKKSAGRSATDYTPFLKADALEGARIGIARDFLGQDQEVDWVVEASLAAMRAAGATVVDVRFPKWLLDAKGEFYTAVRYPEFPVQIQRLPGHAQAWLSQDPGRDDRAGREDAVTAPRRRRPERAALEPLQARAGERRDERCALQRRARAWPGAGHGDSRRRLHGEHPRCHRLPDRVAPARDDQRPTGHAGGRGGQRLQPGESVGLPGPHRAGGLHDRSPAGGHLVRGPGLHRGQDPWSRLRLRASDEGAAAPDAHAGPAGRGAADQVRPHRHAHGVGGRRRYGLILTPVS